MSDWNTILREAREQVYKLTAAHPAESVTLLRLLDQMDALHSQQFRRKGWQQGDGCALYSEGSLASQLATLLNRGEFTQTQLAKEVGCSQATISRILQGEPISGKLHERLVRGVGRLAIAKSKDT